MFRWMKRLLCRWRGHDYGDAVYFSPAVLVHCRRCGREICDRTIDDLEPMTDEDYDYLEAMDRYE